MPYRTILLFGPPGSGKGTWGDILGKIPKFCHVSSGEMFRSLAPRSELGKMALDCIRKGELVPDEHAVKLWQEYMKRLVTVDDFNPEEHYLVLDGLPRTGAQAEMVKDDLNVQLILALDCPDRKILVDRLYGRALIDHRVDDANEETILNRFRVYDRQTADTLTHYAEGLIRTIDVSQEPHKILLDISEALVQCVDGVERKEG
ncbi:MAG: nucleoside monophosphate kinase [bacterium]|nr:nucleoside monophosphate kinase [bacterium]